MNPEDEINKYSNMESFMALAASLSAMFYKNLKKEGMEEPEASTLTGVFMASYLNAPLPNDTK